MPDLPTTPGQDGGELGEEARRAIRAAVTHGGEADWLLAAEADLLVKGLTPVVAALVRAERDRADELGRRWHRHLNEIVAEKDVALAVERDRVRRECAEELRAAVDARAGSGWDLDQAMRALVNRWESGRMDYDEGEQQ